MAEQNPDAGGARPGPGRRAPTPAARHGLGHSPGMTRPADCSRRQLHIGGGLLPVPVVPRAAARQGIQLQRGPVQQAAFSVDAYIPPRRPESPTAGAECCLTGRWCPGPGRTGPGDAARCRTGAVPRPACTRVDRVRQQRPATLGEFFGDDGEAGYVPVGRSGEVEAPGSFDAAEFVDAVLELRCTTRAARSWSQVGDTGSMNPAMTWTRSPRMCWTAYLRARSESIPSWL